jgi:hypothetical protein
MVEVDHVVPAPVNASKPVEPKARVLAFELIEVKKPIVRV